MRTLLLTVACLVLAATPAFADEDAAKKRAADADTAAAAGENKKALALYREALALHDSPRYRCNVGIAYYKVKDWPRAHLFLAMCLAHTSELDANAVSQMGRAYAFVESQLKKGGFAVLNVDANTHAVITVSSFEADESFPVPRTIWLPHGKHRLSANADGYLPDVKEVVLPGASKMMFTLTRKPDKPPVADPATGDPPEKQPTPDIEPPTFNPDPPAEQPRASASRTPAWISFGVAGGALIGGVLFHKLALDAKTDAEKFGPGSDFDTHDRSFKRHRITAYSLYGVAAVGTAVGAFLLTRGSSGESEGAKVGLSLAPGRASVSAGWRF